MSRKKLVVIGNGMAGVKCVEEINNLEPDMYEIVIYGTEPRPNYNRIMLSKVLQGEHSIQDIIINDWTWYAERNIRLCTGETVHRIDTRTKFIETEAGKKETYDILILATGSSPFIPPIPGIDKERVMSFRSIDDCTRMSDYSKEYRKAAVIGGGLLGLEAARGLLYLGMEAVVVHNAPYIMNRQLDYEAATMLQRELEDQGMSFLLNKNTQKVTGRSQAQGLLFTDGSKLEAQLVIVAVGIRPNVDLARRSGIATQRAVVVDDHMRTSVPDIYAVGECAEHRGISYGLVAPLYEQGKVLARTLCGQEVPGYTGSVPYSQLKVSGVDVFSAGEISGDRMQTAIQHFDGIQGTYKKVLMQAGKVRGAILFGNTVEGTALLGLVQRGADVAELASKEDAPDPAVAAAAALPSQETVCACNNVTKAAILKAIQEQGLETEEQVKQQTKASGSCGGCKPMVCALLKHAKRLELDGGVSTSAESGGTKEKPAVLPVCHCTEMSHAELKHRVSVTLETYEKEADIWKVGSGVIPLKDTQINSLLKELNWHSEHGCPACLPAIRYYIYVSGLMLSSTENDMKTELNGLETEDLQGELAQEHDQMVHIYSEQHVSSLASNITVSDLETRLRTDWDTATMPSEVNIAIAWGSRSPVNVLVSDLGLQASPAGWEIYVGGHAGHPVKEGSLLGTTESEQQAFILASACLQWYRQTAWFDEPLWMWTERLGEISIRETLLDTQFQRELTFNRAQEREKDAERGTETLFEKNIAQVKA
ncbi:FAD-dependent oxidoreductase [Paenibacillus sp. RRE4]|uniref:FAD-dependent oxidoreductase n=1 Tax=Paenibacillus sp. RRE4 TaxID=2962587 RepID=UPI00288159C3|nr:FAD-dependent oxidoreductase [Paenibacillus sp. RRE4]MDT0126045.1 FAD-dependent oxidoreductase [Paenibacillus sp. RRE4]